MRFVFFLACVAGLAGLVPPVTAQEPPPLLPETQVRANRPASQDSSPRNRLFNGLSSGLRSYRSEWDDPRHATILDSTVLRRRQPLDMAQAIEREVGVLIQRTGRGQASPFLRGLTGPQTLLLVDGIRLNNGTFRLGPNQYFNTIDPGQVDRIEVVRGPQSVLWGSDALGGAINVISRRADRALDGSLDALGFSLNQRFSSADLASYTRTNFETATGAGGLWGGVSYLNVNDVDRGGSLGRQPLTGYSQYAGDLRYDQPIGHDQLLTVAIVHLEQMNVPRSDKFPQERRLFDPQQRDLAYVRWQGALHAGFFDAFAVTLSYQRLKEGTLRRKPPASMFEDRAEFDVNTIGASLVFARDLAGLGKITLGGDSYHDDVDSSRSRVDLIGGGAVPGLPQFPDDSYYSRVGSFIEWEYPLARRITMITGLRYSHVEVGATVPMFDPLDPLFPAAPPVDTPISPSFQDWSSSVGLVVELSDTLRLTGGFAEGFRAPLLDELTSYSDNVNEGIDLPTSGLSPEQARSYDVGLKWDSDRVHGQASYFWMTLDGLIERELAGTDPVEGVDFFQRRNVARADLNGLETSGSWDFGQQWSAYGRLWYTLGRNTTDSEPLSRIPPTQGVLGLRWNEPEGPDWLEFFCWLARHQDRLSARDIRDSRIPDGGTPGYTTANIRYGYQMTDNQKLVLGLENIFDRAYRVHGSGIDAPGISATLGYELLR